jgi:hypothetical protein
MTQQHFRKYFRGQEFHLYTEYSHLTWLLKFKNSEGQTSRWVQRLQFSFAPNIVRNGGNRLRCTLFYTILGKARKTIDRRLVEGAASKIVGTVLHLEGSSWMKKTWGTLDDNLKLDDIRNGMMSLTAIPFIKATVFRGVPQQKGMPCWSDTGSQTMEIKGSSNTPFWRTMKAVLIKLCVGGEGVL